MRLLGLLALLGGLPLLAGPAVATDANELALVAGSAAANALGVADRPCDGGCAEPLVAVLHLQRDAARHAEALPGLATGAVAGVAAEPLQIVDRAPGAAYGLALDDAAWAAAWAQCFASSACLPPV